MRLRRGAPMIGTVTARARLGDLLRWTRARLGLARPRGRDWHRRGVGGRWDVVGPLQFEFLIRQGMEPQDRLLDVGCGSLRGGVHAIAYLEPGHYFGIEKEASLLAAGREVELTRARLTDRNPHLHVSGTFDVDWIPAHIQFEYALAQSLLTHLRPGLISLCFEQVLPRLTPDGVFFATFFECPDGEDSLGPSHGWRADELQHPRYSLGTITRLARDAGGTVEYIGSWGHPRDQRMIAVRRAEEAHDSP